MQQSGKKFNNLIISCACANAGIIKVVPVQMQELQVTINYGTLEENQDISHTDMVTVGPHPPTIYLIQLL